jgi:hypothetical protein
MKNGTRNNNNNTNSTRATTDKTHKSTKQTKVKNSGAPRRLAHAQQKKEAEYKDRRNLAKSLRDNPRPKRKNKSPTTRSQKALLDSHATSAPVANGSSLTRNSGAKFHSYPNGLDIEHTEYIFDVPGTDTEFVNLSARINPGRGKVFPWLAGIANNFEMYYIDYIRFTYVPTVPTSTPGFIVMAYEADPTDGPEHTKAQLMQNEAFVQSSVWDGCHLTIPTRKQWLFTRDAFPIADIADAKFYDNGRMNIAVGANGPLYNNAPLGSIMVSYRVKLARAEPDLSNQTIVSMKVLNNFTNTGVTHTIFENQQVFRTITPVRTEIESNELDLYNWIANGDNLTIRFLPGCTVNVYYMMLVASSTFVSTDPSFGIKLSMFKGDGTITLPSVPSRWMDGFGHDPGSDSAYTYDLNNWDITRDATGKPFVPGTILQLTFGYFDGQTYSNLPGQLNSIECTFLYDVRLLE